MQNNLNHNPFQSSFDMSDVELWRTEQAEVDLVKKDLNVQEFHFVSLLLDGKSTEEASELMGFSDPRRARQIREKLMDKLFAA